MYKPSTIFLQHQMDQAYESGNFKKAVAFAKQIHDIDLSYQSALNYGLLAKEAGLYPKALRVLDFAINIDDTRADAHVEKALILYELDQTDQAYAYLFSKRSLLLDDMPWALLAILSGDLGLLDEAMFYATKAIAKQPNAWAYHARAIIYRMQEQYDIASRDFQVALNLDPYNPELWNSYALLFEEILSFDHALEVYNTAIDQFQLHAYFLFINRAKIHHLLNHKHLALVDCEQALKHANDNGDIWFLYANLLHEQGDLVSALSAYNQSLRYIKKDASVHFCKAQLLDELGNIKQAKASYERALRFDQDNPEIRLAFVNFLMRNNLSLPLQFDINRNIPKKSTKKISSMQNSPL